MALQGVHKCKTCNERTDFPSAFFIWGHCPDCTLKEMERLGIDPHDYGDWPKPEEKE